MKLLSSESINLEQVADLCAIGLKRKPPQPRNRNAWHVTSLLDSLDLVSQGKAEYHDYTGEIKGIMSWGRIWESAIDCYMTQYAIAQGGVYIPDMTQVEDDIIASLDGVMMIPNQGWSVCECKLHFTPSEEIPDRHLRQMMAYCHFSEVTLAYYISGYIANTTAWATIRLLEFTPLSIRECWESIVNTRDFLLSRGVTPGDARDKVKGAK